MTPYDKILVELFARQASRGMKLGVERVRLLLDAVGEPDRAYPSIIIAGTNGKGSTSAFTAQLLRAAGKRVALYTSPHLVRFSERIQVDGQAIPRDDVQRLYHHTLDAADVLGLEPTFFELTTVMALQYFWERRAEMAVLEVGLGGRLDATNATDPAVSGICPVDVDHLALLGKTPSVIAVEKAGVMRAGKPAWSSVQSEDVAHVLTAHARTLGTPLRFISEEDALRTPLGLRGPHQALNAALAVKLVEAAGIVLTDEQRRTALQETRWPGRMEWLTHASGVRFLLDGAHNPHGMRALGVALKAERDVVNASRTVWMVAASGDRDAGAMAQQLLMGGVRAPDAIIATQARVATAVTAARVRSALESAGLEDVVDKEDPAAAVELAVRAAGGGVVIAFGSLYAIGAIRAALTGDVVDVVALSG